jgi:formylglycine-generating enzyme required for sulfatase activity
LLGRSSENSLKSQLTDRLHEFHVPPQTLVDQLRREIRTDVRRSLILALGEYRPEEVRQSDADLAVQLVTAAFQEGEDAGLQGAAEWLLKRWNLASEAERMNSTLPGLSEVLAGAAPHQSLRCKSKLGHTFTAIIQPDSFVMGSPDTGPDQLEGEGLRTLEIPRSFAIATTEVTWEEFAEFYREFYGRPFGGVADMNPAGRHRPAGAVTWYDAARYCNWLTQKEGLPASELCFSDEGNTVRPEVDYLQRQGYRLPSEAEWEYACRAGTTADRFCAGRIDTLRGYGWFDVNANGHSHAVAQLKPNDLGLFDIYGNVMEWCLDPYVSYREEVRIDREHAAETFANTDRRVLRGGSFDLNLPNLRSAKRFWYPAGLGGYNVTGFRLARSL